VGTSSNQPSPKTPSWRLAHAVLGNPNVDSERQGQELWRSAIADQGATLAEGLGGSLVAKACTLATRAKNPSEAIVQFEKSVLEKHAASLIIDFAKRALARSVAVKSGASGFASELFSETAAYYISRDLPSFVGAPGRIKTTSEAIALKNQVRNHAREIAKIFPVRTDPKGWRNYVSDVLSALRGGVKS
jgi:hypothetical protein